VLDVEAFMGLAQLSLGLAGFSGIALALATGRTSFTRGDRALVRFLLVNSLGPCGLAVLPVAVAMFAVAAEALWFGCSLFHCLCIAAVFWPLFGPRAGLEPRAFLWCMRAVVMAVFAIQFANVLAPQPSGTLYFTAVALVLPGTALAFGRLLFDFLGRRTA
jgi:hypothetical protein